MHIHKEAVAFILIGVINTVVGYLLYAFFLFCNLNYSIAFFLATCLGVLFNFQTTGKIVFNNSNKKLLLKFIVVYLFLYIFNIVLIKFTYLFLKNYYWAGMVALIPSAVLSFFLNKYVVFRKLSMDQTLALSEHSNKIRSLG